MDELKSLTIQINSKCNLHCKHCVVDNSSNINNDAEFSILKKVIDKCLGFGLESVDISLKEPLIYKDIIAFLEYLKKKKVAVELLTNGTLLTNEKVAKLVNLISCLYISLDGVTALSNDYIRGDGVFEKVINGIKKFQNTCKKNNIYIPITLKLTINSANVDTIEDMNPFFQELGVDEVVINPIQIEGKALKYRELQLKNEVYLKSVEELIKDYSYNNYSFSLKFPQLMPITYVYYNLKYKINQSVTKPGCISNHGMFSLNSKGVLYSCAQNCYAVNTSFGEIQIPHIDLKYCVEFDGFFEENRGYHAKISRLQKEREVKECSTCPLIKYCNLCPLMSIGRHITLVDRCLQYKKKLENLIDKLIKDNIVLRLKNTACVRINRSQEMEFTNYYHGLKISQINIQLLDSEKAVVESVLKKGIFFSRELSYEDLLNPKDLLYRLLLTDCFELADL